jgi:hypothetical protein
MLLFPSSIAMAIVVSKLAPNMEILANNKVMEECCLVGSTCCDPDYIPKEIKSADTIYCGYFIPHFPFTVAMLDFFFEDGAKNLLGLSSSVAYMCLGICTVFYYFLYEYLDAIIPNAYGIKKGCCCCLTYCRKKKVTFDEVDDQLEEMGMNKKHNESLISEHRPLDDDDDGSMIIEPQNPDILKDLENADLRASKEEAHGQGFGMRQSVML